MKVIFVAMTDSIHTARWINQIADRGWDIHLFPVYSASISSHLRNVTVYGLAFLPSKDLHKSVRYKGFLPIGRCGNIFEKGLVRLFPKILQYGLSVLVNLIRPDIIHSLEFQHGAYLTMPVVQTARKNKSKAPKWIATNWGSDVYLFGRLAAHRKTVQQVLEQCDFYSCECERDVSLAQEMGLAGQVLPVIPNTGGFDLPLTETLREPGPVSQRRIILLKGYQNWAGRALVGLRALSRCNEILNAGGYKVAIYSASPEVKIAAELFEQETGVKVEIISESSHDEMLRWFGRARLYIGLSISDAISTSLLEAMVMGAFPIQSSTACADEWIENGTTGFIVPPDDPDIIDHAIRQALQDNDLVDLAAQQNRLVAVKRLDQNLIRPLIAAFYEQVINSPPGRKL
jgi:hypothetical protein